MFYGLSASSEVGVPWNKTNILGVPCGFLFYGLSASSEVGVPWNKTSILGVPCGFLFYGLSASSEVGVPWNKKIYFRGSMRFFGMKKKYFRFSSM